MTGPDTDGTSKPSSAVDTNGPVTKSPPTANFLVVLGMHRSGTSALAGLLNAAGAGVSNELLVEQPEINRLGFWEDSAIVALNDRLLAEQELHWFDWQGLEGDRLLQAAEGELGSEARAHLSLQYADKGLSVCKDPRFCLTLPFWKRCIADVGLRPAYLLCLRHPAEVAASLQKRDALPPVYGTLLWMTYTLAAVTVLEGEAFLRLDYTEILESPATVIRRISDVAGTPHALDLELPGIDDAVDATLRHHSEHQQTLISSDLQFQSEKLYRALRETQGDSWVRASTAAASYLAGNPKLWPLIASLALDAMRRNGELVEIGEKHRHALNVISEKDGDIAGLAKRHGVALATIANKDRDIARLGARHGVALETIAERDAQLRDEVAWREHLEQELRKYQTELAEFNEGLLALPLRLRRKLKGWAEKR